MFDACFVHVCHAPPCSISANAQFDSALGGHTTVSVTNGVGVHPRGGVSRGSEMGALYVGFEKWRMFEIGADVGFEYSEVRSNCLDRIMVAKMLYIVERYVSMCRGF
jgi:hypothetical protein